MRCLLLAILLCLSSGLFGATQLRTRVTSNSLQERELFYYTLEIVVSDDSGNSRPPQVELPAFPQGLPFKITAPRRPTVSTSTSLRVINGRTTREVIETYCYDYIMLPTAPGQLQLPAMDVKVDGVVYKTQPITVTVAKSGEAAASATGSIIVQQECDSPSVVPGMPVHLRYRFAFPPQLVVPNGIGIAGPEEELRQNFRLPPDFDLRQGWKVTEEYQNGMPMQCYVLEMELVPVKAGEVTLPPFSLTLAIYDDSNSRGRGNRRNRPESFFDSFFDDDPFFSRRATRQVTLASNELTIHVGELPEEGRPENFSGILGEVTASASMDQQQVSVGDPIILEIKLQGNGVCADMKLPPLQDNPAVTALFNVSSNEDPGQYDAEHRTIIFQRTVRPHTDGLVAFPSLEIPYYDPVTKRYASTTTNTIPLTVKAVKQVTLQDATLTGSVAPSSSAGGGGPQEKLENSADGLAADFSAKELLDDASATSRETTRRQMLLFAALPAVVWLLCLAFKGLLCLRNASPEKRAARSAASQLRRAAKAYAPGNADSIADFYHALQLYAARRFNLASQATVTIADLETLQPPPATIDAWRRLLEAADAARYAGSAIPAEKLSELLHAAMK